MGHCGQCRGRGPFSDPPGFRRQAHAGLDVQVLGDNDQPVGDGDIGAIVCRLPLPPGALSTLWQAEARFRAAYLERYPGFYQTGDAGYIDAEGYLYVMTRTDDVINVAGHRLSTGAIEEVIASHADVAECAVTGVKDDLKGQVPVGFVCLKAGVTRDHGDIVTEVVALVREQIGPVVAFKRAMIVQRLPKTRSGKILRSTLRAIVDGDDYNVPATIDDPVILDEIAGVVGAATD